MDDDKKVEPHEELAELDNELTLSDEDKAYFESGGELPEQTDDEAAKAAKAIEGEGEQEGAEGDKVGAEPGPEQDGDGKQRTVPHGAFHAEREEHKKTKAALAELQENFARVDERLKLLTDLHKPKEEEQEVPDPEIDLPGYIQHLESRVAKAEEAATKSAETVEQDKKERDAQTTLETAYAADARRFMTDTPDFGNAYQHLLGRRAQELAVAGYTDQAEIARIIQQEEMELAQEALKAGDSPSERIYKLAKLGGYVAPEPEANKGNGAAANGAAASQDKSKAAEKLQKVAEAQEANKSLSKAGGAAGGDLTAEALAEMSEEEFQEVYERLKKENPNQLRQLMM